MSAVPFEFIGLARCFRQRVVAADARVNAGMPLIVNPLRDRLRHKSTLRQHHAADAARAWPRAISDAFTLGVAAQRDRWDCTISEVRVSADRYRGTGWDDDATQLCVNLLKYELTTTRERYALCVTPLATVSLHALARRFERGAGRDDAATLRDLTRLATVAATDADDGAPLPTPREVPVTGGRWAGDRCVARDHETGHKHRIIRVSTFLNEAQEFPKCTASVSCSPMPALSRATRQTNPPTARDTIVRRPTPLGQLPAPVVCPRLGRS